jgi:tetratricopeptide (TPR) repeat protein
MGASNDLCDPASSLEKKSAYVRQPIDEVGSGKKVVSCSSLNLFLSWKTRPGLFTVTSVLRPRRALWPMNPYVMVRAFPCIARLQRPCGWTLAIVLLTASAAWSQKHESSWQEQVREQVHIHNLDAALALVDQRLEQNASDLEARGWRGRLLAWQGHWAAAENEYRRVLDQAPNDTEILCGLADVLLWQEKPKDALRVIDHARAIDPSQTEILLRRARILRALQSTSDAKSQYYELLRLDPGNREARNELRELAAENKHELRIGSDGFTFNYTTPAEDEVLFLTSHWTPRFTTTFNNGFYERFGQLASNIVGSGSFRVTKSNWLTGGGAFANRQKIIPENETFFEYGHGLRFSNRWVKGLEASYQQHWFWYQGAHVLTLSGTQLYYLPKEWTWSITVTGARSGFTGTSIDWVPSGYTRLNVPLYRNVSGNALFANGTEDFSAIDQIGHFSARTFAGGLKYRFAWNQDITGYVGLQKRTGGETQNSFGLGYGFHF